VRGEGDGHRAYASRSRCISVRVFVYAKPQESEMNPAQEPFVSVVTPVYNGERYLIECIESVLSQTYQNWEYIIVDNCSTDKTQEIASRYALHDSRFRIVRNDHFVGVVENHNIAFRLMSPRSRYCKVVSADDYLFPECIEKLVEVAECNPRVAMVGSYAISTKEVRWLGIPHDTSVFDGREICRQYLLGAIDSFGTPSAVLYRSAHIRSRDPFYPGSLPNADLAACLISLESSDFAFVHQILSFERIHDEAISAALHKLNGFLLDRIQFLYEYGPTYLERQEIEGRRRELLRKMYGYLAVGMVNFRGNQLWKYYQERLVTLGRPLSRAKLAEAVCMKLADLLLNPKHTLEKIYRRLASSRKESPSLVT